MVDADLSGCFNIIPHEGRTMSVARHVSDEPMVAVAKA